MSRCSRESWPRWSYPSWPVAGTGGCATRTVLAAELLDQRLFLHRPHLPAHSVEERVHRRVEHRSSPAGIGQRGRTERSDDLAAPQPTYQSGRNAAAVDVRGASELEAEARGCVPDMASVVYLDAAGARLGP